MPTPAPYGFTDFLLKDRFNRLCLLLTGMAAIIQFIVFKQLYPYPNFLPDSYSYIEAAWNNASINMWPIGYSRLLAFLHAIMSSDFIVVGFQYFFLLAAILYFIFTLLYFLRSGRVVAGILIAFWSLNPILLYVANYISSDAVFTALSLVWIIQLIWIICRPGLIHIWVHAVVLLLVFMVRYNALYYPFISVAVFLSARMRWQQKLNGVGLSFLLIGAFIWQTGSQYALLTGSRQFSPFGGWQMASNALYTYVHVDVDRSEPVPAKFAHLDNIVRKHADSLNRAPARPDSSLGVYYLWDEQAPLKQYANYQWKKDTTVPYFRVWSSIGPLYASYGAYLIRHYPGQFIKHFLWPNTINYCLPPLEFLGVYNMDKDSVEQLAVNWFQYKTVQISSFSPDGNVHILNWYPSLTVISHFAFLIGFIGFLVFKGVDQAGRRFAHVLVLIAGFMTLNFCFSVFAAPVVMRYQLFPLVLSFSFAVLIMNFIYSMEEQGNFSTVKPIKQL